MQTLEERVKELETTAKDQQDRIDKYRRFMRGALVFFAVLYIGLVVVFFVSYIELRAGLNYLNDKVVETYAFFGAGIFTNGSDDTIRPDTNDICCKLRGWE